MSRLKVQVARPMISRARITGSRQIVPLRRFSTAKTEWPQSLRCFVAGAPIVTRTLPYLGRVKIDFGTTMLNFGAVTSLTGFMMTDVLALRSLSVVGSMSGVIYNVTRTPKQLNAVLWGFIFIGVNTVQIIRLLLERKETKLSVDEAGLYFRVFSPYGVEAKLFLKLMSIAEWNSYAKGDVVVASGKPLDRVHLLVQGSAAASSKKGVLYVYSATGNGSIIGATAVVDPSILGRDYPNTIIANDDVRAVSISTQKLLQFLKENESNVEAALFHLMYVDLIEALRRDRKLSATLSQLKEMVSVSCQESSVSPQQKRSILEFLEKNSITDDQFRTVLDSTGWSPQEWNDGIKSTVSSPSKPS